MHRFPVSANRPRLSHGLAKPQTLGGHSKAKDNMFARTDIKQVPWCIVNSDVKKKHARPNCISHLLLLLIVARQTMYVDASRLNVRGGPSKTDKVVWTVKRDEAVLVTEVRGDWSFIASARYEGWVYCGFLTRNKTPQQQIARSSLQHH